MNRIIALLILSVFTAFGQNKVELTGRVTDDSGYPVPGVNIIFSDYGASTDSDGFYEINGIQAGTYAIRFSAVGFESKILESVNLSSDTKLNIILNEKTILFDAVVVTAGKHEQNLKELPVSAAVMQSREIERKNFITLDNALRYVPGVSMTLDQVSIRGSSGYSRGAGTRVLVALDGIPMYTGDSGEIIWEVFPMPEIERVEVIKGAASSLYGSSAIGGVVNVLTKKPGSTPITFVRTYGGFYDKPANEQWDWSESNRFFNGLTVGHSNNSGNLGYALSLTRTEDMGYRQGDWKKRYAGYVKLSYPIGESDNLTFLANGYVQDKGTFNFWKNLNNALVPPDADQGQRIPSERILTGLIYNSELTNKLKFTNRLSFYHSYWKDGSESLNASNSKQMRNEFQFDYEASDNLLFVSGVELNYATVNANIFGQNDAYGFGVYIHGDYKLDAPVTLTAGLRYDFNKRKNLNQESAVSPKIGVNYKFAENLSARLFFGTGFRAPSVAETFTSTITSGLTVRPNTNLKSESNYSIETGVNYSPTDFLELDAAIFYNRYFDLIETSLDTTNLTEPYVYFDNVTNARIAGFDFSSGLNLGDFYFKTGYTFLDTEDLDEGSFLKYRPKHLLYLSATYRYDIFEAGFDFRYSSRVDEIDDELIDFGFVADGENRVEIRTFDLRFSAALFRYNIPGRIGVNVYNLFNYNYVEMIANISPIRNISLNLDIVM